MSDPSTSQECIREAFQALLRGDVGERDRLCARAKTLLEAEEKGAAIARVLAKDFYVTTEGVAIPTMKMAKAAGVIS